MDTVVNQEWLEAPNGYDKRKNPQMLRYRRMTVEEAKSLSHGTVVCLAHNGVLRNAKINGSVKTWKRSPERVRVPMKYGLYEYFYLEDDGSGFVTHGVVLENPGAIL